MMARRILFLAPAQTVTRIFPQLRDAGVEVGIAENLKGASAFMRKGMPSLILSRPVLPGYRIEDLLVVGQEDPQFPPVIVFSDRVTPEEATHVLELGARDYWSEPLSFEKIQAAIPGHKAPPAPAPSSTLGGRAPSSSPDGPRIVGNHPAIQRVLALAKQVARSKATVLISGESGTGKEMFSRYLHSHSDRAGKPFVAVNCAALPADLIESELFGAEKGAFTGATAARAGRFERAHGGTLLLDELAELPLPAQAKLLRVLQEGEIERLGSAQTRKVDVRVVAATNVDLEQAVAEGRFRRDLLYRLNVYPIRIPPLRERTDDLEPLALHLLAQFVAAHGKHVAGFTDRALSALRSHDWPGNVRELENLVERGVILAPPGALIDAQMLFPQLHSHPNTTVNAAGTLERPATSDPAQARALYDTLARSGLSLDGLEDALISEAVQRAGGNLAAAARTLGLTRPQLSYRLARQQERAR